jgi:transcriptional regulator NrdR family protein
MDSGLVRDSFGERRYRRRLCKKCKGRFTTYEFVETDPHKYRPVVTPPEKGTKRAPKPKQKQSSVAWVQKIMKMIDDTNTAEKIVRREI